MIQIHIVATVALLADTSRSVRISEVVVSANITLGSRVALVAQTDHIVCLGVQQTLVGVRMSGSNRIRTTARPATNLRTQQWISVVSIQAPVALPALCEVLALGTFSRLGITSWCMSVTFAHLTVREVPESRLTLIALSSVGIRVTITLTGYQIAIVVLRSDTVTIASFASLRSESVCSRCTLVTLAPNHVGLARAVSSEFLTFLRRRTGRITFACWNDRKETALVSSSNLLTE